MNSTMKIEKIQTAAGEYDFYKEMPYSMYKSLLKTAQKAPEKICIIDDDGTACTYHQFLKLVDDFSKVLYHIYHVAKGAHVGVLLYNSIEFCASIYALNKLCAVAVPLSTKYRKPEILSLVGKADLNGIIYHKDFFEWFSEDDEMFHIKMGTDGLKTLPSGALFPEVPDLASSLEDRAILMFTSGTTSQSKGVLMANYNIMHAIAVYKEEFGITERDKTVLPVPAYHVTGLIAVMGLFIHAGGSIRLHKFFNAQRVLMEIKKYKLTFLHASPTVFSMLLEQKNDFTDLPSLRIFACGSGNMPKQKILEVKEWIPQLEFRTVYGLTETTSPATIFPEDAATSRHIGSSGKPVAGMEFQILDEDGKILEPLETGTVFVKGTTVTVGYYKLENDLLKDGWLNTGDIGYFDEDGYLYLVDRKKDMINRGGEKICSFDVENVLYNMPGIKEAAVVAIPDERYGEVPAAMIVADAEEELNAEKLRVYMGERMAKYKIPVKFIFCHCLPMTPNMKIDKKKIREILSQN